jgi:hypothetical protein
LDDSILLLWAYGSESGPTRVGQPQSIIYYGDYNKKYLYGTFYIPPNSGQQIWEELEQSIDLALNSNHDIIITGDFNINQFGNNTTKTDNLLAQFSFHQLITEPTYVTERIRLKVTPVEHKNFPLI